MRTALVIGAGVGGIAVASRLAKAGYQVTVVEKQATPGGRLALLSRDGFRFDVGPSLFLMPPVFAETYAALGQRMEDHLDLMRIEPTYRVHFHDGSRLELTSDVLHLREQLEAIEPGSGAAALRFLGEGCNSYYKSLGKFVGRNFYGWLDYLSLSNLPLLFELKALVKHYANVSHYFRDPRLRAAFSFQNMYLGLSPFAAPATFSLLQYAELGEGVWFPRGGMYRIAESLTAIAEGLGVRIRYGEPVKAIDVDGSRASGVTLASGEHLQADVVVANADLPYVYSDLLPDDGQAAGLARKKYTSSAIVFYWALRGAPSPLLTHHSVFLSDHRYRESFESIFERHTLPEEPSFYVHAPVRSDPSLAPAGCDAVMVLVPVGHMSDSVQDWDGVKDRAREAVLRRLAAVGLKDLRQSIIFEEVMEPRRYLSEYNLAKGAAFGLSHNFTQVGYMRPRNRHSRYGNLYFAGASTHPGTGLPIVLLSAKLTGERILKEQPAPR
jgi:phytoene desaturase